jgi:murein DD-endopeptidase MepM/ murein hydrolase activator NlpD
MSRTLRYLFTATLIFLLSCSHYQSARFVPGNQEFSTPDEYLNSPEVQQNRQHEDKGPFRLVWPVQKPKVNRGFNEGRGNHQGLDLGGRKGQPIFAAHGGTVIYVGSKFKGYGRMVLIEYDQDWATLYGHLTSYSVKVGQRVLAGQKIGGMGRTGRATGVHLHFELIKGKQPIDPLPYLKDETLVTDL